jgi:hypothetical protein
MKAKTVNTGAKTVRTLLANDSLRTPYVQE